MEISRFYVGQIPARPMSITVRDPYGGSVDMRQYNSFSVVLLDSDNRRVDLTGGNLSVADAATGRFILTWPKDRSVFTKPGEYVMQLEFRADNGARDFTTEHTIRVRKLGGAK